MKKDTNNKILLGLVTVVAIAFGTAVVKSQTSNSIVPQLKEQKSKEQTNTGNSTSTFNLPDYTRIPVDEAEQHTQQVLELRTVAISKLIAQVEAPRTPMAAKAETIYLLGALRAPEAVTALIENINFVDSRVFAATRDTDRGGYIARRALVEIGEPSARWIYLIIADAHNLDTVRFDKSQVEGFVEVLAGIETPKVALMKLKEGREKARDAKIKGNFDLVIEGLKKMES